MTDENKPCNRTNEGASRMPKAQGNKDIRTDASPDAIGLDEPFVNRRSGKATITVMRSAELHSDL